MVNGALSDYKRCDLNHEVGDFEQFMWGTIIPYLQVIVFVGLKHDCAA
jgi:hypothetical protein